MTLACLIIDDEPIARKLLQEYIEETDFLKLVGVAENPVKAIGMIDELAVDLIFLDINMPKVNGLEFLKSSVKLPMVIMTTAYGQYALDGFELSVVDYLVKPFSLQRFLQAGRKALELHLLKQRSAGAAQEGSDHFFVKCDGKMERVAYADLIYVEAMANYITLHTAARKLIVYLTIKGMLEKLPPEKFLQVHKSYIVNSDRITAIQGNIVHLSAHKVTIGASYMDEVTGRILKDRIIKR